MSKKLKYNIEQRNKYLDDLGLKPHEYGVNFIAGKDKRRKKWKKQQKKYGFDTRETWALDDIFAQWLYCRLKMYLKDAGEVIDLSYWKVTYKDKVYTQEEAIKKMIKWLKFYLKNADKEGKEEEAIEKRGRAAELWAIVLPYMSW